MNAKEFLEKWGGWLPYVGRENLLSSMRQDLEAYAQHKQEEKPKGLTDEETKADVQESIEQFGYGNVTIEQAVNEIIEIVSEFNQHPPKDTPSKQLPNECQDPLVSMGGCVMDGHCKGCESKDTPSKEIRYCKCHDCFPKPISPTDYECINCGGEIKDTPKEGEKQKVVNTERVCNTCNTTRGKEGPCNNYCGMCDHYF